jgi:hypothetical protein
MKNRARKKCLTECPGKRGRITTYSIFMDGIQASTVDAMAHYQIQQ